jgi:hypothetical protein
MELETVLKLVRDLKEKISGRLMLIPEVVSRIKQCNLQLVTSESELQLLPIYVIRLMQSGSRWFLSDLCLLDRVEIERVAGHDSCTVWGGCQLMAGTRETEETLLRYSHNRIELPVTGLQFGKALDLTHSIAAHNLAMSRQQVKAFDAFKERVLTRDGLFCGSLIKTGDSNWVALVH